jgi:hypothetical protein
MKLPTCVQRCALHKEVFKEPVRSGWLRNSAALTLASPEREQGVKIFLCYAVHEIVRQKNEAWKKFHAC